MAVLSKGTTFATNDQVTALKLNNLVDAATFDTTGAVDNSTTQVSSGAIIVKDGGISTGKIADDAVTADKISAGGPSWDASGNTVLIGTTTNDAASTGIVGELLSSLIASASGVSVTSATPTNVTSVALTAGDWDVSGYIFFEASGATNIQGAGTVLVGCIGSTSATLVSMDTGRRGEVQGLAGNGYDYQVLVPVARLSLAGTTTYYLIGQCTHNGTVTASGSIRARRVR